VIELEAHITPIASMDIEGEAVNLQAILTFSCRLPASADRGVDLFRAP